MIPPNYNLNHHRAAVSLHLVTRLTECAARSKNCKMCILCITQRHSCATVSVQTVLKSERRVIIGVTVLASRCSNLIRQSIADAGPNNAMALRYRATAGQ